MPTQTQVATNAALAQTLLVAGILLAVAVAVVWLYAS